MVAAIVAVANFFDAVETSEPDAEPLAHLPDNVDAAVLGRVIERGILPGGVVQVNVSIADGRAKHVIPPVGVSAHRAPIRQRLETASAAERRVAVDEPRVIPQPANAMP